MAGEQGIYVFKGVWRSKVVSSIRMSPLPRCCTTQAKQDIQQMKQMASGVTKKLGSMASKFMNDLGRY